MLHQNVICNMEEIALTVVGKRPARKSNKLYTMLHAAFRNLFLPGDHRAREATVPRDRSVN